jgi:citrate synthase
VILATLVDCLAPATQGAVRAAAGEARTPGGLGPGSLASRLWDALAPEPASAEQLRAMNAALVLLADHELAASTFAARVAASTWADPYHVVVAGLGTLDGPLHGRASEEVATLFEGAESLGAAEAVGRLLRTGNLVPGFGHKVYERGDPRSTALLDLVDQAWPGSRRLAAPFEILDLMAERGGPAPNVDFALGALVAAAGLGAGAGEAVFAIARVAGWIAHAIEEYPHRLRFRPRAVYVGPAPGSESWW